MTTPQRSIVYIADIPPADGTASSVVLYRHLRRFEEDGFSIIVFLPEHCLPKDCLPRDCARSSHFPSTWQIHLLPSRRWWYPPYRLSQPLRTIRYFLLWKEVESIVRAAKPECIVSLLHGTYFSGWAAYVATRAKFPLGYFYHDSTELLKYSADSQMVRVVERFNKELLEAAERVWTVSARLQFGNADHASKFKVVLPLPEQLPAPDLQWRDEFATRPVLAYAGALYNEVVESVISVGEALAKRGGTLLLLTHLSENAEAIRKRLGNTVEVVPPQPTTAQACQLIARNASAFLVAYPEDESVMPWARSCFPSKFTQFAHTGLPVMILSPRASAIGDWCTANHWQLFSESYSEQAIGTMLTELMSQEGWEKSAAQTRAALIEFDPESIHASVRSDIESFPEK